MSTNFIPQAALLRDLANEFPGLYVREINGEVWISGEADINDFPIFSTLYFGHENYNGSVHVVFEKWLEDRGWYLECQDYHDYKACTIASAEELPEQRGDK